LIGTKWAGNGAGAFVHAAAGDVWVLSVEVQVYREVYLVPIIYKKTPGRKVRH
jgi:hypothetical protein